MFDTLRNGKRSVTSDLMDVVLQALDSVNEMFDAVRSGAAPENADPELIERLHQLAKPASEDELAADDSVAPVVVETVPAADEPAPAVVSAVDDGDITDDEFEQLLDALDEQHEQHEPSAADQAGAVAVGGDSDEITDDEFEALLDQLHGKGRHSGAAVTEPAAVADTAPADVSDAAGGDDLISDSEFEELLDRLHGKGKHSAAWINRMRRLNLAAVTPAKPVDKPAEQAVEKPAAAAKAAPKAAPAKAPAPSAPAADKDAAAETTVRVDTKRLDDIMNMVGELVLVRNRLVRLGLKSADESMSKAVANLDVVTGDLQAAVMKTRMQPIKKVFGRFPAWYATWPAS